MNIERDQNGVAHIVGLSGGKDSTALAFKLREDFPDVPFNFICTPTSDELPEMFLHWRRLGERLGRKIIPIVGGTLKSVCAEEKALPNWRMRFCTRRLKIEPFAAFLLTVIPAVSYIGLRADEPGREGADYGGDIVLSAPDGVTQRFYLRELGWGIGDVLAYNESLGIEVPDRTDCARCFFQRLGEWYLLWLHHPEIYADAEADEEKYGFTYRSPGRDTWPASLKELRVEFERGRVPEISLRMMEKRKGMCRACTL